MVCNLTRGNPFCVRGSFSLYLWTRFDNIFYTSICTLTEIQTVRTLATSEYDEVYIVCISTTLHWTSLQSRFLRRLFNQATLQSNFICVKYISEQSREIGSFPKGTPNGWYTVVWKSLTQSDAKIAPDWFRSRPDFHWVHCFAIESQSNNPDLD